MANVKSAANHAWLQFWTWRAIPILQESRNQIMGMMRRAEMIRPSEVAEVVSRDPLLTTQVLRMINQRERGSLSSDIVAIDAAIMLIGVIPFLEQFARAQTIESLMLPANQADYGKLLKLVFEARLARRLASHFANARFDAKLGEIQAAAVLQNITDSLVLIAPYLDSNAPSADSVDGTDLLVAWKIPEPILALVLPHKEPSTRSVLQQAVVPLARLLESGWWQDKVQQKITTIATVLNLPFERVWQLLVQQLLSFTRKEGKSNQLYSPARWLAMLPGEWPQATAAVLKTDATVLKKDVLAERMQALHLAGVQGTATNQVMVLAVRALSEGLGMQRIAFTLLMAAENSLRARYVQGVGPTDPMNTLRISLEKQHVLTKLLLKPQSFWLNSTNYVQFSPHLPIELLENVGAKSFCAMSIFVGDKPVGLIYADAGLDGAVTEFHYQHFKQICILASKALAHNARRPGVC